jgi:IclR family acetate operon transcriptional repressor
MRLAAQSLVNRAIQIIELLAEHVDGLSVTAIAERLGIPASATHRLLITLAETHMVEQDALTKHHKLSLSLPALGLRYLSNFTFMQISRPVMEALASETRELVRLAIVDENRLIWIAKAQGSRSSLRIDPLEGREAILHVTAAGKAWLASMADEQVAKLARLKRTKAKTIYGPNALHSMDALIADLAGARRNGFAVTYDEAELGVVAIGAVIRNGAGAEAPVVGTISVAGPSARLTRKDLVAMSRPVLAAAQRLSEIWPATSH